MRGRGSEFEHLFLSPQQRTRPILIWLFLWGHSSCAAAFFFAFRSAASGPGAALRLFICISWFFTSPSLFIWPAG